MHRIQEGLDLVHLWRCSDSRLMPFLTPPPGSATPSRSPAFLFPPCGPQALSQSFLCSNSSSLSIQRSTDQHGRDGTFRTPWLNLSHCPRPLDHAQGRSFVFSSSGSSPKPRLSSFTPSESFSGRASSSIVARLAPFSQSYSKFRNLINHR